MMFVVLVFVCSVCDVCGVSAHCGVCGQAAPQPRVCPLCLCAMHPGCVQHVQKFAHSLDLDVQSEIALPELLEFGFSYLALDNSR